MTKVIAALLLAAFVVLLATLLVFAFARAVIWYRNRRPPVVYVEQMPKYEFSDRERR